MTGRALSIVKDMTETINIGICTGGTLVAWCKHKCTLHECSLVTLTLNSLFFRTFDDFWWVSTEVGKKAGVLMSKGDWNDRLAPPLHGWQYLSGGKMHSDPSMVCSREVSLACREVRVDKLARLICILDFK